MVALLLRLRFRVLATTLSRNVWQLVAVVVGGVQALPLLAVATLLALVVGGSPAGLALSLVELTGAAIVVGWAVVPLLFNGVEQTLDPARLAPFPIPTRKILGAQLLVGMTWVPGIATLLVGVLSVIAWRVWPTAAALAVPCGLLGAITAIALSRAVATATGNLLAGRRRSVRITAIGGLVLVLAGPALAALVAGLVAPLGTGLTVAARILGWTPYGAAWAVPGWVALGDPVSAVLAAVIAVAGLAVILVVWRLALGASLRYRGSASARTRRAGLGLLGRVPATPIGAIAARSLHSWLHDPRLARQLIMLPLLPALFVLWDKVTGWSGLALAGGPFAAALVPLAVFAGISYDGTAFAAELAAGVRGRDDRIGRAVAILVIAGPALVVIDVVTALIAGRTDALPALVGMTVGVLLSATAVVSVSSARIVIPVPRAGRNPFSAAAGAGTTSIVASYAVAGLTAALAAPELILGAIAITTGSAALGLATLVVSLVIGAVVAILGIRVGGALLDARGPELLARLRVLRV